MTISIYLVLNLRNGKVYVGQTRNGINARWHGHCKNARAGSTLYLARAIRKYGVEAFHVFTIAVAAIPDDASRKEAELIAEFNATDHRFGYNLMPGSPPIVPASKEYRTRLSAAISRAYQNPALRAKISAANRRRCQDPAYRAKFGATIRRAYQDPAYRAKISQGNLRRITRGFISWNKGTRGLSVPWNKGKSSWNKGKHLSAEARAKISAKARGRAPWNKGLRQDEVRRAERAA